MSNYSIRDVRPGDAEQLGAAHVAIWKSTYAGMIDGAKLDGLRPAHRIGRWEQIIAGIDDASARGVRTRCAVYVPDSPIADSPVADSHMADSHIVGFATGGSPRDEDPPARTELWSLNVLPEHHGTGVANDLMVDVIGHRDASAYLWVAAANDRAIAFYRKHRFELDGTEKFDSEWECLEARMVRA
ncbi:GNAT family N-acetyltransferase [Rhodococcus sp. NPDC078407]|uniref:GNAT family N-acetyltransferase n=1 Tax=Rhodococcus sp. NPDC078407 TaxID=3364509 RepID=UPI0037CBDBB0